MAIIDELRSRYRALAPRERRLLILAGVVVILFLLDQIAIQPLLTAERRDRQAVAHERRLLHWMEGIAARVDSLRHESHGGARSDAPLPLLAQKTLASMGLHATKIESTGRGSLKVVFASVSFPRLVSWLHTFALASGARIRSLSLTHKPHQPGMVSATVTLKRRESAPS